MTYQTLFLLGGLSSLLGLVLFACNAFFLLTKERTNLALVIFIQILTGLFWGAGLLSIIGAFIWFLFDKYSK